MFNPHYFYSENDTLSLSSDGPLNIMGSRNNILAFIVLTAEGVFHNVHIIYPLMFQSDQSICHTHTRTHSMPAVTQQSHGT